MIISQEVTVTTFFSVYYTFPGLTVTSLTPGETIDMVPYSSNCAHQPSPGMLSVALPKLRSLATLGIRRMKYIDSFCVVSMSLTARQ